MLICSTVEIVLSKDSPSFTFATTLDDFDTVNITNETTMSGSLDTRRNGRVSLFDRAECNGINYLRAKLAGRPALNDSCNALVIGAESKRRIE